MIYTLGYLEKRCQTLLYRGLVSNYYLHHMIDAVAVTPPLMMSPCMAAIDVTTINPHFPVSTYIQIDVLCQ